MFSSGKAYKSITYKILTIIFAASLLTGEISWALPIDCNSSRSSTLAPKTRLFEDQFRENFALGQFLLSGEAAKKFVTKQVNDEIDSLKDEWMNHRVRKVDLTGSSLHPADINSYHYSGNIKWAGVEPASVVFVKLAGLFASIGQPAWVDLFGELETSKHFGGLTVVYIDSMYADMPDPCVERHEIDEVLQWEFLRIKELGINNRGEFLEWLLKHMDSPDENIPADSYFCGMTSRQIAKTFHEHAYSLAGFYAKFKELYGENEKTDDRFFDYGNLQTMAQMYGFDRDSRYPNIAAADRSAKAATNEIPTQNRKIKANGITFNVRIMGHGEPVFILHGGPGFGFEYLLSENPYGKNPFEDLAENYQLIFFDQRASGESEGRESPGNINFDNLLEDIRCLQEEMGFKKIHLMGHCFGAFEAIAYTSKYPDKVSSLALLSPFSINAMDYVNFGMDVQRMWRDNGFKPRNAPDADDPEGIKEYYNKYYLDNH